MREGAFANIDLAARPGKVFRIGRPSRMAAHADFLGGSGRDGRDVYHTAPGFAIEAAAHVSELPAIRPDLRITQRRDVENRIDGPRLRCVHQARAGGENCQQAIPGFP